MRADTPSNIADMIGRGVLAGVTEIAELLGVTRSRADQLSRQKGFPEPHDTIGSADRPQRIWLVEDVLAWRAANPRPPKKEKP